MKIWLQRTKRLKLFGTKARHNRTVHNQTHTKKPHNHLQKLREKAWVHTRCMNKLVVFTYTIVAANACLSVCDSERSRAHQCDTCSNSSAVSFSMCVRV